MLGNGMGTGGGLLGPMQTPRATAAAARAPQVPLPSPAISVPAEADSGGVFGSFKRMVRELMGAAW